MRFDLPRLAPGALLLAAASGCSVVDSSGYSREPAYIEFYGNPVEITVPATARLDEPVTVSVTTYGGGCTHLGDTQVAVSGGTAELRPYDVTETVGACPTIVNRLVHQAEVIFDQVGTATVRVYGRSEPGGLPLVETRTITVQPAG